MNRKNNEIICESILAGAGVLVYICGTGTVQRIHPFLSFLLAAIAALMMESGIVLDFVRECRKQHGFNLGDKQIWKDLLAIVILLVILLGWLIVFPNGIRA